jgi:hypothetical protein
MIVEPKDDGEVQPPGHPDGKRSRAKLTGHVPIRFPEDTIRRVRALAYHDGVTVSTWIRQVVGREIERRLPSESIGLIVEVDWTMDGQQPPIRTEPVRAEPAGAPPG